MSEQIKRIENDIMKVIELVKKDNAVSTTKSGDCLMKYLEKAGTKNEDFLFIAEELKKPLGIHTSFIAKTYAQFNLFLNRVFTYSLEVTKTAENMAVSLTQEMMEEERRAVDDTIPQLMSRFGYTHQQATSVAEEAARGSQVQAQFNSSFRNKLEMIKTHAPDLVECIRADWGTRSFRAEPEPLCRISACEILLEQNEYFEFEKMSSSQLSENDKAFLAKMYELCKDSNVPIQKLRPFVPQIIKNELEEEKKELAECKSKLEAERKKFKAETEGKAAAAKKELAEIDARIAKGFFPKTTVIVTVVSFLIVALFSSVIRWEGKSWEFCVGVSGLVCFVGVYILVKRFMNGSGEEKKLLDKKRALEKSAYPNEDKFGEIEDTKYMIEFLEDEIKALEEELKSIK